MARFFTYCWQHSEMLRYRDGTPVRAAYGSQFTRRGVRPEDVVYIVSVHRGRVHLLGKMLVGAVTPHAAHYKRMVGEEPEPAEYLIAEACTAARLVQLSDELAQGLRFHRGKQRVGLAFREKAVVDHQSLRSVRQLSAESAPALDELLPALEPVGPAAERSTNEPRPQTGRQLRLFE